LIGNVSRDLINPLTAIIGYIDLLKAEGLDDRCKQYLQKLQSQTEKMQDIVMALNSAPPARLRSAESEVEEIYSFGNRAGNPVDSGACDCEAATVPEPDAHVC